MPPASKTVPPVFAMKVDNGLFLDNQGRFSATAPGGDVPVYEIGGGLLSLSANVKGQMVSGQLAILPLANEPSWKPKLRELGLREEELDFIGKVSDLVGYIVTIVGVVQAAIKVAEWLGILKSGPSVEELAATILQNTEVIKDMIAQGQQNQVQGWLDESRIAIRNRRNEVEEDVPTYESAAGADRQGQRIALLDKIDRAAEEAGKILAETRWKLFFQIKYYDDISSRRIAFLHHHDGVSWVPVEHPGEGALPFDHRAALPHTAYAVLTYLTMLKMFEPEYRSTGLRRKSLIDLADDLALRLKDMRKVLARTVIPAWAFSWSLAEGDYSEVFGVHWRRPLGYWRAGAVDLRAGSTAFFQRARAAFPPPMILDPLVTKVAGVDFDWIPPNADLKHFVYPYQGGEWTEWRIQNAQAVADEANRQSMEDYAELLVSSGFLTLAQIEAMLRHLATDPDSTETVSGIVRRRRSQVASESVTVVGITGRACEPEDVTAPATLRRFRSRAAVDIGLQPPGRDYTIPYTYSLVSMTAPPGEVGSSVLAEAPLQPGTRTVTLERAQTFDWFLLRLPLLAGETTVSDPLQMLSDAQLDRLILRRLFGVPQTPEGEMRHQRLERLDLSCTLEPHDGDTELGVTARGATVVVENLVYGAADPSDPNPPSPRNFQYVYLAVKETLHSGKTLRTYFDVSLTTQLHLVPLWLFEREQECIVKAAKLIEKINYVVPGLVPGPPPGPVPGEPSPPLWQPVSRAAMFRWIEIAEREAPDVVARALAELDAGRVRPRRD